MANNTKRRSPIELKRLQEKHCQEVLIRERWVFGDCRGEAEAIYLQLDDDRWVVISADPETSSWVMVRSTSEQAHQADRGGDSHYRIRDAAADFGLAGLRISNVIEKKLDGKIELCIEFSNATDLTVHYNLSTGESSLYFIKD